MTGLDLANTLSSFSPFTVKGDIELNFNLTLLHITPLEEKYMRTAKVGGLNDLGLAKKHEEFT